MTVHASEDQAAAAKMAAPQPTAGWYPDPSKIGRRYWDGTAWTVHSQALLIRIPAVLLVTAPRKPKSAKLALALGLLFGPFGMLYTTLAGFAVMLTIGVLGGMLGIAVLFPAGVSGSTGEMLRQIPDGVIVVAIAYWIGCAFWSCISTPAPTAPPRPFDPKSE